MTLLRHRRFARLAAVAIFAIVLAGGQRASGNPSFGSQPGIVFERGGDLFAVSLDGRHTVQLTHTPVWGEYTPAASPDGRWIAYSRYSGGTSALWIMSVDGRKHRRLTSGDDNWPAWSADSRFLYFARSLDRGSEECGAIFRKRVDGTEAAEQVTDPRGFHSHFQPSVSPDNRIAFTDTDACSGGDAGWAVSVVNRFGWPTGDLARLPGNDYEGDFYEAPGWSPDGKQIALLINITKLYVANPDGSELRRVTPRRADTPPRWSADGKWIAFVARARGRGVFVVHPDGSGLRRLTFTKRYDEAEASPSWLPRMPG